MKKNMSIVVALLLAIETVLSKVPSTFDYTTNENGQDIGWIKVFSCDEASSGSEQTFANGLAASDYYEYFPEAIAVQLLPNGGNPTEFDFDGSSTGSFAVMTDICSVPVIALNNNLDLSWPIDPDTLSSTGYTADSTYIYNNWLGTDEARDYYIQGDSTCSCSARDPSAIYDSSNSDDDFFVYWACCNHGGVHLTRGQCSLDYQNDLSGLDSITMYLGFDLNKRDCCAVNSDGDPELTDCPTLTADPTTAQPTTAQPTTANPTTAQPTTAEPTTAEPTTSEPTTPEPTPQPTADCSLSLRDYLDECVCEEGFGRGRFSRSQTAQIETPFSDNNDAYYRYNDFNDGYKNINNGINPNGMIKLILPPSVFYVLLSLVIVGVVTLCGGSAYFIRKFVEGHSYSKNGY